MDIIIGLTIGLITMDIIQMVLPQVLMFTPMKLDSVTMIFIKLLKASQVIGSNANGQVNLELKKEESLISKLDLMMVQDSGLMVHWLLITGDFMELFLEKEVLNLERVTMILKLKCLKTEEVLLLMPTGEKKVKLISHLFMFTTKSHNDTTHY